MNEKRSVVALPSKPSGGVIPSTPTVGQGAETDTDILEGNTIGGGEI